MLKDPKGNVISLALILQFQASNNVAEYEALLAGLRLVETLKVSYLEVKSNSLSIVNQVKGEYKAKQENMKKKYLVEVRK